LFLVILHLDHDSVPRSFRKTDPAALGMCLPGLCITGALTSLGAAITGTPGRPIPVPDNPLSWTAAILGSLSTGYLEESYFRVYLPRRLLSAEFGLVKSFALPVLVFGLCHAYEGPWGFANALVAGSFLSLVYIKTASFHGIALAHGIYNILVYLYTAISP
jgi:membrane protease YdiL (CAAX protease family)